MLFLLKIEYLDPEALFSVEILRLHYLGYKFLKTMKYILRRLHFLRLQAILWVAAIWQLN